INAAKFTTSVNGNEVKVLLQEASQATTATTNVTHFAEAKLGDQQHVVKGVDFQRGKNGEGRIDVELSDAATGIDIRQQGKNIIVDFVNTDVPESLERRLNVVNFNTPVLNIDTLKQGKNTRLIIEPKGNWEYSSYQADKRFTVDVRAIVDDPNKLVPGSKPGFNGEKLSLNFQNIEVRSVLQVIADFTGLNVVTSDTVNGSITLRLKDVPWDQAMDIIMQSKGLSQRKIGNIIWVAPSDELAAKEKQQLEAQQQVEDLEPLYTEVFTLKYQKANDLKAILTDSKQKILSKRGSAVVDPRTNTLFVQDTAKYIAGVQRIINKIDIAVRQVLIESRIVIADTGFSKELGVRFGIVQNPYLGGGQPGNGWNSMISGSTRSNYNTAQTGTTTTPTDLNVNLPATSPTAGSFAFSIFKLPAGILLNLELSAAEADSKSKLISSPRVITMNQQKATIEQGVEIPYQQASSSGATNVSFKKATLSLAVTPQITPDDKISMDLDVHKDSVGQIYNGVPSINTRQVTTQVQVDNGETAVLGGIYEEAKSESVDKVPFFGDLPVLGHLFKRNSQTAQKNELLIFITPKLMQDSVL
ncbi:MAG TPA: type IV pilus secretin PilQ family protein, partial [Methylophilaceae bacterium]|nr:type IV pilus secretin PilQ family protein [Methylophilaceae bacterium]